MKKKLIKVIILRSRSKLVLEIFSFFIKGNKDKEIKKYKYFYFSYKYKYFTIKIHEKINHKLNN